jgi:hypothetical protein
MRLLGIETYAIGLFWLDHRLYRPSPIVAGGVPQCSFRKSVFPARCSEIEGDLSPMRTK